jgi:hypothetical protein
MKDEGQSPFDLRVRTKQFALGVIRLFRALPRRTEVSFWSRAKPSERSDSHHCKTNVISSLPVLTTISKRVKHRGN